MKRPNSLEQERAALLEQLHSSRAAYRRMLAQYDQPPPSSNAHRATSASAARHFRGLPDAFPRSMTMRWIVEHPYAVAGIAAGVIALVAIGPRRVARSVKPGYGAIQRSMRQKLHSRSAQAPSAPVRPTYVERENTVSRPAAVGSATLAGTIGLVSMVMRDPAKMRMVARAASAAMAWLKGRRQQRLKSYDQRSLR